MSERSELSEIIIAVTELRDKSSFKKTYDNVLNTLKRKLSRKVFDGYKLVDSPAQPEQVNVSLIPDSTLTIKGGEGDEKEGSGRAVPPVASRVSDL
jgi:hypothetical protein